MYVMTVRAMYLSSSDNLAPAACRTPNKSAENPANVIIRPANVYKKVAPLTSMYCSILYVVRRCWADTKLAAKGT
jgi:hypothetical protein